MRGRTPTPTKLKVLQGNPGHRRLDRAHEPEPEASIPECPEFLGKEAKKEWFRTCQELYKLGLLTQLDRGVLTGCCSAWEQFVTGEITARKLTIQHARERNPKKRARLWGELCVAKGERKNGLKDYRAFCAELGLSAASRTRIKVPDGQLPLNFDQPAGNTAPEGALDRVNRLAQ